MMNIGCVVMAAGMSSRFGGNKLAQQWQGKSLIRHALEAVPADRLSAVVVVTQYPEVVALAKAFGFTPIVNSHPEYGQSHTIHLGVRALERCDALLFQVADQPLLRRESVARLIDFYGRNPGHIVGLGHGGQRGNPCIFPARFFPELLKVEGDRGGNVVIRQHESDLLLYEVPADELRDVDTQEALAQL